MFEFRQKIPNVCSWPPGTAGAAHSLELEIVAIRHVLAVVAVMPRVVTVVKSVVLRVALELF